MGYGFGMFLIGLACGIGVAVTLIPSQPRRPLYRSKLKVLKGGRK